MGLIWPIIIGIKVTSLDWSYLNRLQGHVRKLTMLIHLLDQVY